MAPIPRKMLIHEKPYIKRIRIRPAAWKMKYIRSEIKTFFVSLFLFCINIEKVISQGNKPRATLR